MMTISVRPPLMHARTTLSGIVARWDRRLRLAQTLHWLPVALLIGTLAAIALALAARLRPLLGRDALIPAAIALIALSAVILLALIWLPRRTFTRSARHFDLLLDLDERLSTAAELLEGRISAPAALFDAQITDAQDAARGARVRDRLPLRHHWRAWLALTFALIALAVLIALSNPQDSVIAALAAEQAAIEDARAALREITEAVAAEPGLSDQERADLLQILETNRAALELPNITPEEAFAAVSEVRSALQETSARIQQRLAETAQALQAASDALSSGGMPGTDGAALQQALEALRDQAQALSGDPAASAALAQRLEAAADALAAASPAAAQALREAASAVRSGDPGAAQAALDRAGAALQQAGAQSAQQAGTSSALDQAAQAAGAAAQAVRQATAAQAGIQPQDAVEGEQRTDTAAQAQPADAAGTAAQQGAEQQDTAQQGGAQGQQGAAGQQSQQGAASSPGDQAGQQGEGGGQGQPAQIAPGGQQAGGAGQTGGLSAAAVSGAGDMAGSAGQDAPALQQQSGPIAAGNNPDGLGERAYEPVYAPRRIGDQPGGTSLFLEPDAGDAPLIEGDFAPNAAGESIVPYDQVFAQYQQAANAALDTGRVPLALRDIIRSYFSALEPRR